MALGVDAKLTQLPGGLWDISIGFDGDIATENSFDTAIIVSLFTDARATEAQVQPSQRRRGWIGNEHTPGFEMGGLLWVPLEQGRFKGSTLREIEDAARGALQWLVDEGHAVAIRKVLVAFTGTTVTLSLTIERRNSVVEARFFTLWQNTGVS